MFKKHYPKTVKMRKGILIVVAIVGLAITMTIIFNIKRSSSPKAKESQQQQEQEKEQDKPVAGASNSAASANWYKDQEVKLPGAAGDGAEQVDQTVDGQTSISASGTKAEQKVQMRADQDLIKARTAPISAQQISVNMSQDNNKSTSAANTQAASSQINAQPRPPMEDQNMQEEKKAFSKEAGKEKGDYLQEQVKDPVSPYEVKAGTIIPGILLTGINSDLPGQITGQVRSNVYDTVTGKYLLIPQGAKLIGLYDSQIAYGQERVLIIWKRIIMPNGKSIDLEGMPGADLSGYAGFNDQVNNHYGKIFGSVILMSIISAGAQLSQPDDSDNNDNPSVNETLAASLGTNIMNTTNAIVAKNLGIQPTLEIRQGYLFNINVTKDIVLPGEYAE